MERGSNNNRPAPRQEVAYTGFAQYVPAKSNVVPQYHNTVKYENKDKATGNYQRYTTTEAASSGARHVERGSGQLGVRNEASQTSTVKVGNKTGYTEYYKHERVREVDFGPSYQSVKNSGGNSSNQLTNSGGNSSNQLTTYDQGGYYSSDDDYY